MPWRKAIFGILVLSMLAVLGGCSSNSSSSSGFGSGSGYQISLTATQTSVPIDGQTTLMAVVKDPQGNLVNDSSNSVRFTSSLGATISPDSGNPSGGVVTVTYLAPDNDSVPGVDQVTASFRGAFAYVSIYVYLPRT